MADEIELTEMHDIEVTRQDGVRTPASGFGFLIMKSVAKAAECDCCKDCPSTDCACEDCTHMDCSGDRADVDKDVNAVGGMDEKPDIAGADTVLSLLYKLLESEAREGALGAHEEADIQILSEAITLIRCFRENEMWNDGDDGDMAKSVDGLVFKAHRKFSSDERKSLASEGKALSDGSYPIPDEDALRRAAILARSGHGDVAAAKRLIAKRAKELGVSNPLAESAQKDAEVEPTETPATTEPQAGDELLSKEAVEKMIEDRLAAVIKDAEGRAEALAAELDVLKATPIPGQVALTATAAAQAGRAKSEAIEKAVYHERRAERATDPEVVRYHSNLAKEARAAAQ